MKRELCVKGIKIKLNKNIKCLVCGYITVAGKVIEIYGIHSPNRAYMIEEGTIFINKVKISSIRGEYL